MKVTLNEVIYNNIIKGIKESVSTDIGRPILRYILLKVDKNKLTAYATDGYKATKIETECKSEDTFECLIKPIQIKVTKTKSCTVEIESEDNIVTIKHQLGLIDYEQQSYHTLEAKNFISFEKLEDLINKAKSGEYEKGTNIRYAIDTLSQLAKLGYTAAIIKIDGTEQTPFYIAGTGEKSTIKSESIVLPVRLH